MTVPNQLLNDVMLKNARKILKQISSKHKINWSSVFNGLRFFSTKSNWLKAHWLHNMRLRIYIYCTVNLRPLRILYNILQMVTSNSCLKFMESLQIIAGKHYIEKLRNYAIISLHKKGKGKERVSENMIHKYEDKNKYIM